MCGVAGAIGAATDHVRDAIRRASASLRHRGPDGEGLWCTEDLEAPGGVVLGHRRLAIIDLSDNAAQPMVDPASGCVLSYNGEVYNFRTLRSELCEAGVEFRSRSDTEVVLKAYAHWGIECVRRFRGMFAFAIWDPRSGCVHLVRDHMGVKPLYYAPIRTESRAPIVLFASEVRALLATGLVPRKLDPIGLSSYLWNGFVVGPSSIVRGVHLLPAGCTMTVHLDGTTEQPRRYWQPASFLMNGNPAHAVDELGARLHEAVESRLVSDVPLGIFLSGGIDSSAIAAMAMRGSHRAIKSFNVSFDESEFDESRYGTAVAQAVGTEHHTVGLTGADFRRHMDDALESLDQPTFDAINTYFVSRAVRETGVTVALAGTGGDELFGGYSSFVDLPRAARISRAARALSPRLFEWVMSPLGRLHRRSGTVPPQTRWGKLADVLGTGGRLVDLYQTSYALFTTAFFDELVTFPIEAKTYRGLPACREEELASLTRDQPTLHAISMLEMSCFLGAKRLLRDTDSASMAVSLEVRVPLIDRDVVTTLAQVPCSRRFRPLGRKRLLCDLTMEGIDQRLFDRPKAGFVLPYERWMRRDLQDAVASVLTDSTSIVERGINPDAVNRLWKSFESGARGVYWSRIWAIFVLLWWCREHRMTL